MKKPPVKIETFCNICSEFCGHFTHLTLLFNQWNLHIRLRRTFEHGLMYKERKRWHSPKPQCVRQMQPEDLRVSKFNFRCNFITYKLHVSFFQVSLDTTETAFFLLLLGILLSVSIVFIENAIWFYKQRKQTHTITYLNWNWVHLTTTYHSMKIGSNIN